MTDENLYNSTNGDRKSGPIGRGRSHRRAANRSACSPFEGQTMPPTTSLVDFVEREEVGPQLLPLWVRLGTRMLGSSLDARLAEGQEPDTSPLLAARVQLLVSPATRRTVADSWLNLLIHARERFSPFDPRVPLVRSRIIDTESQIYALSNALVAPLPTARGVAMASSLLCDGAGPLYNPGSSVDLAVALSEVVDQLDPMDPRATLSNR